MPPWNELVIYEMHVETFPDAPARPGELFDAVIHDLGYLKDLGVNAIELLPTSEFPGDLSWGYNPAHIFAVESSYGGPEGVKRLIDAAHSQGIAIIFDVVYNHFGPSDLSIWQFDGWFECQRIETRCRKAKLWRRKKEGTARCLRNPPEPGQFLVEAPEKGATRSPVGH